MGDNNGGGGGGGGGRRAIGGDDGFLYFFTSSETGLQWFFMQTFNWVFACKVRLMYCKVLLYCIWKDQLIHSCPLYFLRNKFTLILHADI